MKLKIKDQLPDTEIFQLVNGEPQKSNLREILGNGKIVLFGLPGAFTSTCSKLHLPGFVTNADKIKAKGIENIFCLSVNDPYVMNGWGEINNYKIDKNDLNKIKKNFISEMLDENETVEMIKTINDEHQMVVDPHTAVGIGAVRKLRLEKNCVVLSTAHPCKFPKAIEEAISKTENLPDSLKYVNDRKEKFELLSNDIEKIKKYVMNST